jgi:pyruvate ferredoxin oxidoreductase beta subunit/2-oxoisovalerate ferredoxin oxidoreductase beta subunit
MEITGDSESAVMAWAGDGGTFDIGLQSLSGAVERNEDIIYVCYDNEAYMNTGVQRSSSTPYGTHTTTTPEDGWKRSRKKNIMEIMAAHRIPYAASASIAFPDDMRQKFDKARRLKGGSRFLHVFATCPTGWGIPSELSIKIARLAVQCNIFPLYEVENGVRYTLNYQGDARVDAYLGLQGRFRYLSEKDIRYIQRMVDEDWDLLMRKM